MQEQYYQLMSRDIYDKKSAVYYIGSPITKDINNHVQSSF